MVSLCANVPWLFFMEIYIFTGVNAYMVYTCNWNRSKNKVLQRQMGNQIRRIVNKLKFEVVQSWLIVKMSTRAHTHIHTYLRYKWNDRKTVWKAQSMTFQRLSWKYFHFLGVFWIVFTHIRNKYLKSFDSIHYIDSVQKSINSKCIRVILKIQNQLKPLAMIALIEYLQTLKNLGKLVLNAIYFQFKNKQ